jgi:hypothetical protein
MWTAGAIFQQKTTRHLLQELIFFKINPSNFDCGKDIPRAIYPNFRNDLRSGYPISIAIVILRDNFTWFRLRAWYSVISQPNVDCGHDIPWSVNPISIVGMIFRDQSTQFRLQEWFSKISLPIFDCRNYISISVAAIIFREKSTRNKMKINGNAIFQ